MDQKNIIIVDLDGTLADSYEWQKKYFTNGVCDEDTYLSKVKEFPFRKSLLKLIELYINSGHEVMFLTSRPISSEKDTREWLSKAYDLSKPTFHLVLRDEKYDYGQTVNYKLSVIKKLQDDGYIIDLILDDTPNVIKGFLEHDLPVLAVPNSFELFGGY